MDANKKQIANETIEALIALGHKKQQARRMVNDALAGGFEPRDASDLLQRVYSKPTGSPTQSVSAAAGPYAIHFAEYLSGSANYYGEHSELLQIAQAVGPGLTPDQFGKLAGQVEEIQGQRGRLTNAEYQRRLWEIPEKFKAAVAVHFRPMRDSSGRPIDVSIPATPQTSVMGLGAVPAASDAGATAGTPEALASLLKSDGGAGSGESSGSNPPAFSPAQPSSGDSASTIRAMLESGSSSAQPQASAGRSGLDAAQSAADALGVIDQTGITDLTNAGVSVIRAMSEPDRAGEHLSNAVISAISAVPVVGDVAKIGKYGANAAKAGGAGVNAKAQAALQAINVGMTVAGGVGGGGQGGGGQGGGGGGSGNAGAGGQGGGMGGGAGQAASGLNSFSGAIQRFLNGTGAAVASLTVVGNEVYNRTLKPILQWLGDIDERAKRTLDENRPLARFSSTLDSAYQNLEGERLQRQFKQAEIMEGAVSRLAKSQSKFEGSQQDLTGPYQRLGAEINNFRVTFATYVTSVLNRLDLLGNVLDKVNELWPADEERKDGKPRNSAERAEQMFAEMFADRKV